MLHFCSSGWSRRSKEGWAQNGLNCDTPVPQQTIVVNQFLLPGRYTPRQSGLSCGLRCSCLQMAVKPDQGSSSRPNQSVDTTFHACRDATVSLRKRTYSRLLWLFPFNEDLKNSTNHKLNKRRLGKTTMEQLAVPGKK